MEHLEADIVRLYHQIEKGLAMPDFRPRFGVKLLSALIPRLEEWNRRFPCSDEAIQNRQVKGAYEALKEYTKRHEALGIDVEDLVPRELIRSTTFESGDLAGVKQLRKVSDLDRDAFHRVVETRFSVRDFQSNRIPERNKIERSIEAAVWSPSVCNRQTWRVHAYEGERAQEVLSFAERQPRLRAQHTDGVDRDFGYAVFHWDTRAISGLDRWWVVFDDSAPCVACRRIRCCFVELVRR